MIHFEFFTSKSNCIFLIVIPKFPKLYLPLKLYN